jgi:hypothetical protein
MNEDSKQQKLLTFDIETIIDTDLVKRFLSLPESTTQEDCIKAIEKYHLDTTGGNNSFARQMFHKVVTISYVECNIAHDQTLEIYTITNVKSGGSENSTEEELIRGFFDYLNKKRPRIVTFNGRGFDVPVLRYRSMMHKIPALWFFQTGNKYSNYYSRYSLDWHIDLLEAFSDFGMSARIKMSEVCSLLNIPCKIDTDGSMVWDLFKQNQINQIRNYCEQDALATYMLYLYYSMHQGRISKETFSSSMSDISIYSSLNSDKKHLSSFIANKQ